MFLFYSFFFLLEVADPQKCRPWLRRWTLSCSQSKGPGLLKCTLLEVKQNAANQYTFNLFSLAHEKLPNTAEWRILNSYVIKYEYLNIYQL